MGSIKTIKDKALDLTTNTVKGEITYNDLEKWIIDYYSGTVTKFILWDFTEAGLHKITTEEFRKMAELVKQKSKRKERGKSALVYSKDLEFGLGRMFEALSESEGIEFPFKSFKNLEEAKKWLGILK